jgi:hypothetical protein
MHCSLLPAGYLLWSSNTQAILKHLRRHPLPLQAFATALKTLNLTAAQLLANKPLLDTVLSFHVIPTVVKSSDVKGGAEAATLLGPDATLKASLVK